MRAGLYCRVSTKDQNIDTQLDVLKTICERQNYEIYKEYLDVGESGKKESRPAFDEMLKDMRHYKFHIILVYKMDRIGRSLKHLINLFEEFEKKGVKFLSATQNINTDTPEGKMFMRMLMVLAEYEREITVCRVKDGMKRARREGKKIGRPRTGVNGQAVLELRKDGLSIRKIAKELQCNYGTVFRIIKGGYDK